jgi:hypothetical protein
MKRAGQAIQLGGLAAAVALALLVNVLASRHYTRWDWTTGKRYTLTPATLQTLHELDDKIEIWVLLGGADPLEQSVKQLLVSYANETSKLDVHYVDPDRDAVALVDVQQRFRIEAGRSADGRVVTDAVMVVARGDKHWFLTPSDMFEVGGGDDVKAKPREEQAITGAIRSVLGGEKVKLCFTAGHGELAIDPAREGWIGDLRGILEKDNYQVVSIDVTAPNAHEPFKGCGVVVVARPELPFAKAEEARLKTWLLEGGSMLAAVGPVSGDTPNGMTAPGLDDALAPFGIGLDETLVLDPDPEVAIPGMHSEGFFVEPKGHAVTEALVADTPAQHPPRIAMFQTRSLRHVTRDGAASPSDLLSTTKSAYAIASIKGAAEWKDAPEKKSDDPSGPMVVAMASERAKVGPSAPHGPRVVVIGSGYALADDNWKQARPLRGDAFFVENAIAWLALRQAVLDVPERPAVAAGIRITEASRSEVRNYVLIYMPLAAALLGIAVALRRRSTEGAKYEQAGDAAKSEPRAKAKATRKRKE